MCDLENQCRFEPADLDGDGFGAACGGGDDCRDDDPSVRPDAPEVCGDGFDNDCDGLTDCDDPDCAIDPACCAPLPEVCDDEQDNDCDGLTDCEDPDCVHEPVCCVPVFEYCGDGLDNDCDGLIDCEDPDCGGAVTCGAAPCHSWEGNYEAFACGDSYTGNPNFMLSSRYSCGGPEELAQERVHKFSNLTDDHRLVQVAVEVRPHFTNHDVFVLEGDLLDGQTVQICDPGHCIAKGTNPGLQHEWVTFVAEPNRLYFLVVDGPFGSESTSWLINIHCAEHCVAEECADGFDNDCDGLVDCDDEDCLGDPSCTATEGE